MGCGQQNLVLERDSNATVLASAGTDGNLDQLDEILGFGLVDCQRDFVHAASAYVSVKQLATPDSSWEASEEPDPAQAEPEAQAPPTAAAER